MRQLNGNGSNGFAPKDILSHYINIRKFSYYIPELTCPYKSFQSSGVFFRKPPNTVNILAMNPLESPPCKRAHLDACTTHVRRTAAAHYCAKLVTLLWSHRRVERRKLPTGLVSTTGYGVWAVYGWPWLI